MNRAPTMQRGDDAYRACTAVLRAELVPAMGCTVIHAIVNTLAILPGMACDGAKPSCAAKIAEAVDAALLGVDMIRAGKQFHGGDGLVTKGVEATIRNIARLGHDGMRETNGEIIRMMLSS